MTLSTRSFSLDLRRADTSRGGVAAVGVLLLGLIGLALVGLAALMPTGLKGIDPAVLAEAGRGTTPFDRASEPWLDAGKPGTAAVFEQARPQLAIEEGEFPIVPVREEVPEDPFLTLWGGADPFLEQIFVGYRPAPDEAHPPVLPLFVPRQARQELGAFFVSARDPGVRAVLANREVRFADHFMPVDSSAGQPLEATLYLTALLLQGNHVSPDLATEIRRLAELAVQENHLGEAERVYLDLLALGSNLSWQALADLMSLLPDRQALRRTAHLVQALGEDWLVFAAAGLWTRSPSELSRYLVNEGEDGLKNLKQAMRLGEGAVRLLAERQEIVHEPIWRKYVPTVPVVLADLGAREPLQAAAVKVGALFAGLLVFFMAFNLYGQVGVRSETLRQPFSLTFFQSFLIAGTVGVAFLFLTEPLLGGTGQNSEFSLRLPISIASLGAESSTDQAPDIAMDEISVIALSVFFGIQLILYLLSLMKLIEIRRQPIANHLKLRLLENEENLFDAGLYVGLAGTIGGLIFLALDIVGPSLMAAYSSTLFGITFVAFFKIFHLRPLRRRLIVDNQMVEGRMIA